MVLTLLFLLGIASVGRLVNGVPLNTASQSNGQYYSVRYKLKSLLFFCYVCVCVCIRFDLQITTSLLFAHGLQMYGALIKL